MCICAFGLPCRVPHVTGYVDSASSQRKGSPPGLPPLAHPLLLNHQPRPHRDSATQPTNRDPLDLLYKSAAVKCARPRFPPTSAAAVDPRERETQRATPSASPALSPTLRQFFLTTHSLVSVIIPSAPKDTVVHMSDHTAKRQRLTGSFSPASPPYHLDAKTNEQTKPVVHPSTPTSPPYMSANPSSNGGFATNATGPAPEMTPPSSVNMSQQLSQPATSASNQLPFPTPGSTTGVAFSSNLDSDGDATMADSVDDDAEKLGEHRRSNHNRQSPGLPAGKGAVYGDNGATGSSLFKLCQSSKVPFNCAANLRFALLTRIAG